MGVILVTGGAGFIGSHVCERLLKEGHEVVSVDNLDPYYDVNQKNNNLKLLEGYPNFTFYKIDIRDFQALERVFEKHRPERVIHLAAKAGVRASLEDPQSYQEVNVGGTLNLLELSRRYNLVNFVCGSSSSVYGSRMKAPFSEDDPTDAPVSPYAAAKKSAELFCHVYHHLYDMNITCLRFFTVYGPRGRPDMAPFKFTKWVHEGTPLKKFGDGTSKRDYTYVEDVVSAICSALDKQLGFEIINVGNNKPITLNEFIATVEKVVGKKAKIKEMPMQPGDVPLTYADISKAQRLLGYKPKTDFVTGMRKFFDWYKNK